jgi:hypothetical protein
MPRTRYLVAVALLGALTQPRSPAPAQSRSSESAVVLHPPTDQRNHHYVGHREPLLPSPLVKLPVGAVKPRGWLHKQLELQAAGFHGHLTEISAFLRKDQNAWLSRDGQGERGWEEVPYWLKGFGDCAYLLGNPDQIKEAKIWIEGALASQREDGFFGPRGKGAQATVESTKGKYDLWPNMVMLQCLRSYHEFTGDRRVLDLMTKYFSWELGVADPDFLPPYWQQQRAADNLDSVLWLYDRTGDRWLLDLATKNPPPHRRLDRRRARLAQRQHDPGIRRAGLLLPAVEGPPVPGGGRAQLAHDPREVRAGARRPLRRRRELPTRLR